MPRMYADDGGDPPGRPAGCRNRTNHFVELDGITLGAAVALGLQHREDTRIAKLTNGSIRYLPGVVHLLSSLGNLGKQIANGAQNLVDHGKTLLAPINGNWIGK